MASSIVPLSAVSSSIASHIGYNEREGILAVRHHDGSVFHYAGVGPGTFQAIKSAPSLGKALHSKVRGKFPHANASHLYK